MRHQQRADETRTRILAACLEFFTRNGYDATGVAEVCAAAGVSKGAFYHHFPSKQAAFLALLEQWLGSLDTSLLTTHPSEISAPQRLADVAALFEHAFSDAAGQLPVYLEFWRQAARDPDVWQATIAPYRRFQDLFAGLIAQGIAEGSFAAVDPTTASRLLVALGMGLIFQAAVDANGADWGKVARDSVGILLSGLERKPLGSA